MGLERVVTRFLPQGLRTRLTGWLRGRHSPRMVWGYTDPTTGQWRSRTRISSSTFLYHPERISLDDNVFVWHYTILDGTGGLRIGEGSQIGAWVGLFTHSSHIAIRLYGSHYSDVPEDAKQGYTIRPVEIGRYVFVGAGAKILPGVTIGDGSLVGAGSLVRASVPPFSIVEGNPATVVGSTETLDRRYLRDPQLRSWYDEWREAGSSDAEDSDLPSEAGSDTRHA